jgi:transcriptional regulator with XRE-family HTH domain
LRRTAAEHVSDSATRQVAFGRAVRAAREKRGMSQLALARHAALSRSYLWGLERGDRNPTLGTIAELATVLGMLPSELVREAEIAGLRDGCPSDE